jgi:hypothetical protein
VCPHLHGVVSAQQHAVDATLQGLQLDTRIVRRYRCGHQTDGAVLWRHAAKLGCRLTAAVCLHHTLYTSARCQRHAQDSCTWNAATRFSAGMLCQSTASMMTADSVASPASAAILSTSARLLTCCTTAASFCRVAEADDIAHLETAALIYNRGTTWRMSCHCPAQHVTHPIVVLSIPDLCMICVCPQPQSAGYGCQCLPLRCQAAAICQVKDELLDPRLYGCCEACLHVCTCNVSCCVHRNQLHGHTTVCRLLSLLLTLLAVCTQRALAVLPPAVRSPVLVISAAGA